MVDRGCGWLIAAVDGRESRLAWHNRDQPRKSRSRIVMSQPLSRLNPPSLPNAAAIGYSQITTVEPGRMAYVSGQVAVSVDGSPVPEDLVEQTRIVVRNLRAALAALGATANDIVLLRIFAVDLRPETMDQAFPVLLDMLDGAQPCITGVGVAALAATGLKIEVEMTVRIPD